MMLMIGIVAGAGLMAVKNLHLPGWLTSRTSLSPISKYMGWFLCVVIVGLTLFYCIPARQNTPYYHMIDDEDYQAFVWIKENVGEKYDKAVLDPWKGIPFTALSGKTVYTRIHAFPQPSDTEASTFLSEGCSDTGFLKENGISIVYTRDNCSNPDLVEVRKWVYLLEK